MKAQTSDSIFSSRTDRLGIQSSISVSTTKSRGHCRDPMIEKGPLTTYEEQSPQVKTSQEGSGA